jgi:leucyl-tRNA synthetase
MSKVSKTKLNIVDPDAFVNRFGADTVRFYMLSDSPAENDQVWNDEAVPGINRFLHRLWLTVADIAEAHRGVRPFDGKPGELSGDDRRLHRSVHQTVRRMTDAFENDRHFNTGIAVVHELVGLMRSGRNFSPPVLVEAADMLVRTLSPIIPHMAEELWTLLGHEPSVFHVPWPEGDVEAAAEEVVEIALQVNGKVRGRITVPADSDRESVEQQALADAKVKEWTSGKTVRKVIVVPGRLVNIVVN